MKTQSEYMKIVGEIAQVLQRHKLDTQDAAYASAMMFIGAVENNLKYYSDSKKEAFCHDVIQNFYAEKRKSKAQIDRRFKA